VVAVQLASIWYTSIICFQFKFYYLGNTEAHSRFATSMHAPSRPLINCIITVLCIHILLQYICSTYAQYMWRRTLLMRLTGYNCILWWAWLRCLNRVTSTISLWRSAIFYTYLYLLTANNNSARLLKKLQEFGSSNLLRNWPEFFQENLYGIFSGMLRNLFRK
jgi:hypothetical protein